MPDLAKLMRAAANAVDAGDDASAEPLFLQIVALNPRDAAAWHMLASVAIRAGRAAEATGRAERAHQLERHNHHYLNTLGVAHAEAQQFDESIRWFKRALKERPDSADSHYNLGKAYVKLGELGEAERCYLRARRLDPGRMDIANNLAALYSRQGRYQDALPLLAQARARTPDDEIVAINGAVVALATSGPEAAIGELVEFLQRRPEAAAVHEELAGRLLAEGRFAEGWREYAWRRNRPPLARAPDVRGRRVLLLPEQGLGDHLFFLRFAPQLRSRAAFVAFECPAKLLPLLEGTEVVDQLCAGGGARSDFEVALPVGDLPELLEDWTAPPAVPIAARRGAEWRERLAALGPAPYLGVTWRGGTKREQQAEFAARGQDPLYKEIAIEPLAAALRGWPGTILVLQRVPLPGELELFSKALGRRAHDLCALNEELEDMAAVLSLIDEYVGVSNTNMHLRAGLGKTARVLVPFPPEFRWMHADERSPWFPGCTLYRQAAARDWAAVLTRLGLYITH